MAQRQWREEFPSYVLVPQRKPGGYRGPKPDDERVADLYLRNGLIKYTELRGVKHNSWIQAFTYDGDDESKGFVTRYSGDRCDRTQDVWQWLFRQRKPSFNARDSG